MCAVRERRSIAMHTMYVVVSFVVEQSYYHGNIYDGWVPYNADFSGTRTNLPLITLRPALH
jgi:hypothetical protein